MIKKVAIYVIIFFSFQAISSAQEIITGLQFNQAIYGKTLKSSHSKGLSADTLELPFFDDFCNHSYIPDESKWSDNDVFINNTYSDQQITTGIATFDAIDNTGKLYEYATSSGFEADHLTSQPVNLDYDPSVNIWLSFYYEPGGLGDPPDIKDSLTLHFYAPAENKWISVWKMPGSQNPGFKPVIIRIDQSRFLKKGFRFRFVNYASLSPAISNDPSMIGNCDHWNIDYVILDRNRNEADTNLADVAFRLPLRSILKTHEAMPWKQFRQVYLQEMGSSIPIYYRNNDKIVRNVTRNFIIQDVYSNVVAHSFSAGATNIAPYTNVDFQANLVYTFNTTSNDSALFRITCYLITDDFDQKVNDTIHYNQVFGDYFAFDDGSAEAGYGINGMGSRNAMFASRFKSFVRDTIKAVNICFNDSYMNSNHRAFDLMIWNDNNGLPGNLIYTAKDMIVEKGTIINGFYNYNLPDPVVVDDVFYVGWKQQSETFLNAGFDVNTPSPGKQFYWLYGEWHTSQPPIQGTVMIRPVMGKPVETVNDDDIPDGGQVKSLRIWPNPAENIINLDPENMIFAQSAMIAFFDISGRELMKLQYSETIDISSLRKGIYIVIFTIDGRVSGYSRLVKIR